MKPALTAQCAPSQPQAHMPQPFGLLGSENKFTVGT